MNTTVDVRSRSRANDISLIALSDLSAAAASSGLHHRVIGGQMVDLLLHYTGTHGQVIDRATADADVGVPQAAATAEQLEVFVAALADRGYDQVAGDRFQRPADHAIIDVLASAVRTRRTTAQLGPVVATEAGGLGFALGQPPLEVTVLAQLTDRRALDAFEVKLPQLRAAVAIKAHAWADRRHRNDAIDIAHLLHAAKPPNWDPPTSKSPSRCAKRSSISDAASVRPRPRACASSTTMNAHEPNSPRRVLRWSAEPSDWPARVERNARPARF